MCNQLGEALSRLVHYPPDARWALIGRGCERYGLLTALNGELPRSRLTKTCGKRKGMQGLPFGVTGGETSIPEIGVVPHDIDGVARQIKLRLEHVSRWQQIDQRHTILNSE